MSWKTRQPLFSPLLESMLIWIIPIVPLLQATLPPLSSIDVSASMSHYTKISLSDCSVPGRCGRQAWLKHGLLSSEYSDVCFITAEDGMCVFTCAVWMCSCACEQVYVVSVVMWTGHRECDRSAVCFLPSFARLPLLSSALPSLQHSLVK